MNTVLDIETIEALRTYKDKEGKCLLNILVEIFLNTVPTELKALRSHFDERDFSLLESLAHSLKSTAGGLGALAMAGALANIEDHLASREGQSPDEAMIAEWMKVVERELDPVVAELRKLI